MPTHNYNLVGLEEQTVHLRAEIKWVYFFTIILFLPLMRLMEHDGVVRKCVCVFVCTVSFQGINELNSNQRQINSLIIYR